MHQSTLQILDVITDFAAFESLCCDLLASYGGHDGIIPQGVGRVDNGKDALCVDSIYSVGRLPPESQPAS